MLQACGDGAVMLICFLTMQKKLCIAKITSADLFRAVLLFISVLHSAAENNIQGSMHTLAHVYTLTRENELLSK